MAQSEEGGGRGVRRRAADEKLSAVALLTWLNGWLEDVSPAPITHSNEAFDVTAVTAGGLMTLRWKLKSTEQRILVGYREGGVGFRENPFEVSSSLMEKVVEAQTDGTASFQVEPGSTARFTFFLDREDRYDKDGKPPKWSLLRFSLAVPSSEQIREINALLAGARDEFGKGASEPESPLEERVDAKKKEIAQRLGIRQREGAGEERIHLEALKQLSEEHAGDRSAVEAIRQEAQSILDRQAL